LRDRTLTHRNRVAGEQTARHGFAGAKLVAIQSIDDARIFEGDKIDYDRTVLLIGIDMMEGKAGFGLSLSIT
jgi:hypothetical protein